MKKSFIFQLFNTISSKLKYKFFETKQKSDLKKNDVILLLYKYITESYPCYFKKNETSLLMRFYELSLCQTKVSDETVTIDTNKFPLFFLDEVLPLINKAIIETLELKLIEQGKDISFFHKFFLTFPVFFYLKLYFLINFYYCMLFFTSSPCKKFLFLNYLNFLSLIPNVYLFVRLVQSKLFFY